MNGNRTVRQAVQDGGFSEDTCQECRREQGIRAALAMSRGWTSVVFAISFVFVLVGLEAERRPMAWSATRSPFAKPTSMVKREDALNGASAAGEEDAARKGIVAKVKGATKEGSEPTKRRILRHGRVAMELEAKGEKGQPKRVMTQSDGENGESEAAGARAAKASEKPKADKLADINTSRRPLGVIGAVEQVAVLPIGVVYDARIDTGAETSSVDAIVLKWFEREGQPWVRFNLIPRPSGKPMPIEAPVTRQVKIKGPNAEGGLRPVVPLRIVLGDRVYDREFTLADRSHVDFGMLIGRNVLKGEAVVDVAKSKVLELKVPRGTISILHHR